MTRTVTAILCLQPIVGLWAGVFLATNSEHPFRLLMLTTAFLLVSVAVVFVIAAFDPEVQ